MNNPKYFEINL